MAKKDELYELSYSTGATKADGWIDIEGGAGTLFAYSSKGRRELPNDTIIVEGAPEGLSKRGTFMGQHVLTSRQGAAVHINAFNFPVWGMLEKLGPTLLAGTSRGWTRCSWPPTLKTNGCCPWNFESERMP